MGEPNVIKFPSPIELEEQPKFFEEVAEPEKEKSSDKLLQQFVTLAKKDYYDMKFIELAKERFSEDITTYKQFEDLLETVIKEFEEQENDRVAKIARIRKSIAPRIAELKKKPNINQYASMLIYKTYNTKAVQLLDLIKYLEQENVIDLEIFEKPVYFIILQIESDIVAKGIETILSNYDKTGIADELICRYLEQQGYTKEQYNEQRTRLLDLLPDNIKCENSPESYKLLQAIQLLSRNEKNEFDINQAVFCDSDRGSEYIARIDKYTEDSVPFVAANAQATQDVYEDIDEETRRSIFGDIGTLAGKVVKLRYELADDFDTCMKASMGQYAGEYEVYREKAKARKAELRELKEQKELDEAKRKIELEAERRQERREDRRFAMQQNMYNNTGSYGNSRYNDPRYNQNQAATYGRNFAPQIPPYVIAIGANVLIGLVLILILGLSKCFLPVVGLVMATFGFIKQRLSEPKAKSLIAGGYLVVVLGFLLM